MKTCLTVVILLLLPAIAARAADEPACPLDHGTWKFLPQVSDEFDGEGFDHTKWWDHYPRWNGRPPGWFSKENVSVADGELRLTSRAETLPNLPAEYKDFTTAAVKSKAVVLYGYFEIRARAGHSRISSSFWLNRAEPKWWTEIDIYEMGCGAPGHERVVHTNVHVFKTPEDGEKHWSKSMAWTAPFDPAAEMHTYGLDWSKAQIRWYVDGKMIRQIENTHWHQPLEVNINSETMPDWLGLPKPEDLPATYRVDYVRAWSRVEDEATVKPDADPAQIQKWTQSLYSDDSHERIAAVVKLQEHAASAGASLPHFQRVIAREDNPQIKALMLQAMLKIKAANP